MQRHCADVNSPYKRKCWTNSGGPLTNSLLWVSSSLLFPFPYNLSKLSGSSLSGYPFPFPVLIFLSFLPFRSFPFRLPFHFQLSFYPPCPPPNNVLNQAPLSCSSCALTCIPVLAAFDLLYPVPSPISRTRSLLSLIDFPHYAFTESNICCWRRHQERQPGGQVDAGWAEAGTGSFAKYSTGTVQCTTCIQKLLLLLHDLHFFVSNMVYIRTLVEAR